jgi:serine/threonine-protein kinase
MKPERRGEIEQLYQAALKRAPSRREDFLTTACGSDEDLRQQVASLLATKDLTDLASSEPLTDAVATGNALTPGMTLGPYQILGPLGEGGMGKVFRAVDARLGRTVAIKISAERFNKRFEREARAISMLNHPNICTLYDVGSLPSGAGYMVTELVEGTTLRDWLKHPRALDRCISVVRQVVAALGSAHQAGIIHRDLKPANIMVRFDGYAKVLDFGLAKRIADSAGTETDGAHAPEPTIPGQIVGTVAYMSPEQILGQEADARSDLFALGSILYEMAAGRHPWTRGTGSTVDTMQAILHADPPPMDAPAAIKRVIWRCLEKRPALRFQSMADLETALQQVATDRVTNLALNLSSIAVLPFANMSGDKENEYFGDGLAEEIINELVNVPGMRVAARTSSFFFKGKDFEFGEIGRRLNVDHILEGSVRQAGNHIRVTAQLTKVSDGFHLWSERYDREITDLFAIQDEITQAIAAVLRKKLSPGTAPLRRYTPNLRAYETYLKARDLWFKGSRPEILAPYRELLERAIELDPNFALAHSFLGMYYTMQANLGFRLAGEVIPSAIIAEQKALRVDPSLPEAHALLAVCIGGYEYDWSKAERHWRLAMAREPVSRDVLFWYGNHYLLPIGRIEEAIDAVERGLEGDPLNLLYRQIYARDLRMAGRLKDAEAELRSVLEIDENFPHALGTLGSICAQQGRFDEALVLTQRAHELMPWSALIAGQLAATLVRTGAANRAEGLIEKLNAGTGKPAPTGLVVFHALCGETELAAKWAERAIEERDMPFVQNLGPFLRSTPWWPALSKLMNLPC